MRFNLQSIILLALFTFSTAVQSQNIYITPQGDDANPGTKNKPVATLTAARDLIRHYKSIHDFPKGGITVWIGKGQYNQQQTFVLNENDSGESNAPILWRTIPNEEVSITGGKSIPYEKFEKITDNTILERLSKAAAENVIQVNLAEQGIRNYGQLTQYGHALPVTFAPLELFFNHRAMTLAQYPNKGYIKIGKVIDGGSVPRNRDYSQRGALFEYTDPRHAVWAGQEDIWLQGTFNYGFADDHVLIQSIDAKKKQIKLTIPSMYGVANGQEYQHYIARNILEELDTPGEWYVDRKSGILYFWAPEDLENSSIQISVLEEPIISIEGASYITIQNLTVEVGRGIGIYLERGSHNLIAGCTIRNMGTSGIFMGQGAKQTFPFVTHDDYEGVPVSRSIGNLQGHLYKYTAWERNAGNNNKILSCDIYNTGSGGIYLSGGSKRKLIPGNNIVENCKIHNYNRRNKFLWAGINIDGCGNKILHCEIFDSEWQGIYVRGNEHLFEYNNIHHVTLNSNDTSPWYIGRDPSDRGNIVRYNYFHHCGNPQRMNMGIYCDDSTTDVEVYGNVFYKMNTTHGVLFSNSGWDIAMKNNIIIEPISYSAEVSAHYYTWAQGQAKPMFGKNGLIRHRLTKSVAIFKKPYAEKYPELQEYLTPIVDGKEWEGMRAKNNVFAQNLIIGGPENPVHLVGGEHAQFVSKNNYRTNEDPGFIAVDHQNFTLKSTSKVFKKIPGFKPVPFHKMGLYTDEYRKNSID